MNKKIKTFGFLAILIIAAVAANHCLALDSLVDTSNPNYATGNYTLNDVRNYAVYIMKLILSLVGTLSLLFFVYGGTTFLLSAGDNNKVKKGIEIIKAATIGLLLTFASVMIINMFFGGIGITWNSKTGAVSEKPKSNITDTAK